MDIDVLIKNGRVIDTHNGRDRILDVAIKDGKIFAVGNNLQMPAESTYDASGCLVTPGLIDAHVHCYQYATPLGVNVDDTCLARGVTTVIDAGSSGASTFMGIRKFIIEKSKTRVRCLLHIALHGLAAAGCSGGSVGGESDTLAILDEESCVECIRANTDVIVGVKVRLSASVCDKGRLENEAFRRALSVAGRCGVPLMTHHVESTVPTQKSIVPTAVFGCPSDLRPGDIYTHTYHGYRSSVVDADTKEMFSDVIEAKSRGVLFDVGHGAGAFNWTVAEISTNRNFWPDLIGSDMHTLNQDGPVYDLTTVMTKFLHLGMNLDQIIKCVTYAPAHAYGLHSLGTLSPGNGADVSILKIEDCSVMLEDSVGQTRNVKKRILPVVVWRDGEEYPIKLPDIWPNTHAQQRSLKNLEHQIVKD